MRLMSILSGKGFVMYNKALAHSVSVNGAIIFGQLCSSYESFGSKNMLTVRGDKEYFFLTSEVIEGETSLSYKQQLKAIKELEQAGFVESRLMGVPSKKFFHITNKIYQELTLEVRSSSDKREDLENSITEEQEGTKDTHSLSKRETLAITKGNGKPVQKGSTIKEKKEKEQYKDKNENIVNYQEPITKLLEPNQFKSLMINTANEFYTQFSITRWSKKQWNTLVNKFATETIESGRYKNIPEEKIRGYVYKSLENMTKHSDYKKSDEFAEYKEVMQELSDNGLRKPIRKEILPEWMTDSDYVERRRAELLSKGNSKVSFYNWLEEDNDKLPY